MRRPPALVAILAAVALALPGAAAADIPEGSGPGGAEGADAIELISSTAITPRLEEVILRTPALDEPTGVRVLLPSGYEVHPGRRYPVLYLLHGAFSSYRSYTEDNDLIEELTADRELIVVMPDSGPSSGYADWYNDGAFGPPAWETYHVGQLVPWIDRRFRTVAKRRARALAGLSMGGGGSLGYAARHPDMFVHAAGLSPAADLTHPNIVLINNVPLVNGALASPPATGSFETDEIRWHGANPVDLAGNLRGVEVSLRTGDGSPDGALGSHDITERTCYEGSLRLHQELEARGIEHVWDYYGPGAHTWTYWARDLRLEVPEIAATFADPPARPRRFSYRSIEPAYDVWGWQVEVERTALEFSRLAVAGERRFRVAGSGAAEVRTPPVFRPADEYAVTLESEFGERRRLVRAGSDGRLRLSVPLGPANAAQQFTAEAEAAGGTVVYETRVAIARGREAG